jgi:hypothetical protein
MKQRHVDIYAPFTFTGGSGGYWPSLPRLTLFSGEAALPGVVLLIALAYSLMNETGRHRACFVALLGSGIAFTQSAAAVLALAVLVAVAVTVNLTKHMTLLPRGALRSRRRVLPRAGAHRRRSCQDRGKRSLGDRSRPGLWLLLFAASVHLRAAARGEARVHRAGKAELAKVDVADA